MTKRIESAKILIKVYNGKTQYNNTKKLVRSTLQTIQNIDEMYQSLPSEDYQIEESTELERRRLFCFESFFWYCSAFSSHVSISLVVCTRKSSAVSDMWRDIRILHKTVRNAAVMTCRAMMMPNHVLPVMIKTGNS
jgi:hypothetical protein